MNSYQISNIILNIVLIATLISIFFFTVGKDVELHVVKTQSEYIADCLAKDIALFINKEPASAMASAIDIESESFKKADEKVVLNNTELLNKAILLISCFLIIGTFIILGLYWKYKFNIKKLLFEGLVAVVCVGITEYVFLVYIGQNFISADPNFVRHKLISLMQEKLNLIN